MTIKVYTTVKTPDVQTIERYMDSWGYNVIKKTDDVTVYQKSNGTSGITLWVPTKQNAPDYDTMVQHVIESIARFSGVDTDKIYEDIMLCRASAGLDMATPPLDRNTLEGWADVLKNTRQPNIRFTPDMLSMAFQIIDVQTDAIDRVLAEITHAINTLQ